MKSYVAARLWGCRWAPLLIVLISSALHAQEHHASTVPPTWEIEVLDPNADSLGRPAVELREGPADLLHVDVPPVVLVHKYYYTGNRSFQTQLLPGGPTILVVNHPKTNERCYIEVQMMPGSARVTYRPRSIEYDFGERGMTIHFGLLGQPKVVYRNGLTVKAKAIKGAHAIAEETIRLAGRTGIPEHVTAAAEGTKNAVHNVADSIRDVSEMALMPIKQIGAMTPLGSLFQASPEREAILEWERTVRRAEHERVDDEATIETRP